MKNNVLPVFTLAVILFSLPQARAQTTSSRNDTIYSAVLQEQRPIKVIFPPEYKKDGTTRYDVLYVLDGEWNTSLTEQLCAFLRYGKFIPANMIVVSIPNLYKDKINMRDRDLTPSHIEDIPISGGADKFLAFLKEELTPYINKSYPAKPENSTLYGTSFGGLFAVYAFLHAPSLFRSYLTIEPPLSYDNDYLIKVAREKLPGMRHVDNTLWIANRDGRAFKSMGVASFDSLLVQQAPEGLDWKVQAYPDETHFSAIWKGIYEGLRFSYKGLMIEDKFFLEPTNGRVVKGLPFRLRCYNVGTEKYIGYTTDGSEPIAVSSKLKNENTFNFSNTTTLTLTSLSNRKEHVKTFRCNFTVAPPATAIAAPKNITQGGLLCQYYKGDWAQLPDLDKIKPERKGIATNNFDNNQYNREQGFACKLEGLLQIPADGYYLFGMENNSHAKVWIDGLTIISEQQAVDGQSFIIYLEKGFHMYKAEQLYKKGDRRPSPVYWRKDGEQNFSAIPAENFYSVAASATTAGQ